MKYDEYTMANMINENDRWIEVVKMRVKGHLSANLKSPATLNLSYPEVYSLSVLFELIDTLKEAVQGE